MSLQTINARDTEIAATDSILVLTPLGKDAEVASAVIRDAGLTPIVCANVPQLIEHTVESSGAILIAEEALTPATIPLLLKRLSEQPPWSDIPVVLLTSGNSTPQISRRPPDLLGPHSNVTVLERPIRLITLTSSLQVALRARRRQFQVRDLLRQREQVLASIQDAFITLDRDWRYTYVNPQACELCQMSADQMLGKVIWDLFPGTVGSEVEVNLRRATAEKIPINFEWYNPRWERWFHFRIYPSDGGVALFTVEITARKEAELALEQARIEAIEANRAKDQFLAALSHELRTPLNPVLMTVAALKCEQGLSERMQKDLEMIHRQVELEARLIDDLLDLTRVTRGKLILQRELLNLHQIVEHAIETVCSPDVLMKQLTITHLLEAPEHYVFGDGARLQQVLWNLLNNAVKFTPEGGHIEIVTQNPAAGKIEVCVADSGIGIDNEMLPRLFDAFEQGHDGITRRFGGLGLGLAISKAIADLHEGSLHAESDGLGKGSKFILELNTSLPPVTRTTKLTISSPTPLRSLRVLLVEDHEPTRGVLERLFIRAGHKVQAAGSVRDALRLAGEYRFDLLVSDLGLPDSSGLELMRELRTRYSLQGIALSGFGMEEDLKASAEAGFTVHLVKPVDWKRLESALASFAN